MCLLKTSNPRFIWIRTWVVFKPKMQPENLQTLVNDLLRKDIEIAKRVAL